MKSLRSCGELLTASSSWFLAPCFCIPRECHGAHVSGLWELRWMGVCDSTMGLKSILFVMALLLSGAAAAIKTYFNETAYLPCQFINSQNISLDELVVFWQNQEKLVVYELYQGKEKFDNVDPKYKNRNISFDEENWTLRLHNVEIKDQGDYQCFIHHKGPKGLVPSHKMFPPTKLLVIANFSQPEIMEGSNSSSKSYRNLTCSSIQGYPQPEEMYFLLTTENSTIKYSTTMQKSQDNITELYNVSISWSYSGFHDTTNRSIICVLCVSEMCLFSKPYDIVPPKTHPPPKDDILWITALSLVIVGVTVFFLVRWKRKKKQPDLSRECQESETIKVEEALTL
nr:T-lymphocyte activation antigen CD86 isoform X2 [Loxodonta africana]